ncbi:substrate-binding periplasmic protein [Desulfovibrio ferrophilus]|uniref:Solute-binding protein family 3/N-terminal domain-containing protein n=1 Tax=Desulfovibrio ferrophilus TaxID=241368 RepID=A0A2Z6AWZ9_9BACT|nr:ABC transporter substrate-binding protein [Desulfovibrio ferrophilus]BBD07782.1 uncharacterized protein DFE_1056 [Desulfovibrio ferrophilus]
MKQYPLAPLRAILTAALVVTLLLVPCNSLAGPDDGLLTLSYNEDGYPPFLIEQEGKISGITVDILTRALQRLDYKLAITLHPEKRGQELLLRGEVNARGKAKEWVLHPEFYDWSEPFLEPHSVIISPADKPILTPTIANMQGLSIAAIHGFSYPYLDEAFTQNSLHRVNVRNAQKLLVLTHKKRVDGAVIDRFTALWLIKNSDEYSLEDFHIAAHPLSTLGYRLMFNKKQNWKPFIKRFNSEIKHMKADGTIQSILDNYR